MRKFKYMLVATMVAIASLFVASPAFAYCDPGRSSMSVAHSAGQTLYAGNYQYYTMIRSRVDVQQPFLEPGQWENVFIELNQNVTGRDGRIGINYTHGKAPRIFTQAENGQYLRYWGLSSGTTQVTLQITTQGGFAGAPIRYNFLVNGAFLEAWTFENSNFKPMNALKVGITYNWGNQAFGENGNRVHFQDSRYELEASGNIYGGTWGGYGWKTLGPPMNPVSYAVGSSLVQFSLWDTNC